MNILFSAAEQFTPEGSRIADVREFGCGNINGTFLASLEGKGDGRFVLQRINTQVFRKPELVMRNMRIATGHIFQSRGHRAIRSLTAGRRWEVPRVMQARDGREYWIGADGSFWRALSFIEGQSFDTITDERHAEEVGYALGLFHTLLSDLPPEGLADTLEGFHVTPRYLCRYDEVLSKYGAPKTAEVHYCLRMVSGRSAWAHVLEEARAQGKLAVRPIHGDPKVNNILIDTLTRRAVSMVDLDTVKPGLVHYDIGDCLRSGCNPLGEETPKWEEVRFSPDICQAVLRGYFAAAGLFLTGSDIEYLYDAIRLIAFELGLRFFTDYLEGNVYFKVRSPGHNLARALVQFRLTESIEAREHEIRAVIPHLGSHR